MNETDIIIRELTEEELRSRKPFAHFGWEGVGAFSFAVISEAYWGSAKELLEKMKAESKNFAVVDSLVYPLFFNYRHSIETYLKLLYFKYGGQDDSAKRCFLNYGHNLEKLWRNLRPYLSKGIEHVGSTVSLDAIEHYIKSINEFDSSSMMMRYPIKKDLAPNKDHEYHFDFVNFGERLNDLYDSLRRLDDDLSNQMYEVASDEDVEAYLKMIEKYRSKIDEFLSLLSVESIKMASKELNVKSILETKDPLCEFFAECDSDLLIILESLFYSGRAVNSCEVRLSVDPICARREFVKFCYNRLECDGLRFGEGFDEYQINIRSKSASAVLKAISTSLAILSDI